MYRAVILCTALLCMNAVAHDMTPTYPKWGVSHVQGVVKTDIELFNKRKDVEYYEIGVFDKNWQPVPFVSSYKLFRLKYLGHLKFSIYVREEDAEKAEYICSQSKLRGDNTGATLVSSKICSRFK